MPVVPEVRAEMLVVGLTGGIGSGKTTASDRFAELGVPVIDTDIIAREVVAPGRKAFKDIIAAFGADVIAADGGLDRSTLNALVFEDPELRTQLEAIVHPAIRREVQDRVARLHAPYCVVVVPLLVETDFNDLVDRVLVIDADDARRREWVAQRSGLSAGRIDQIFAAQASREQRLAVADDVLVNDTTLEALAEQVTDLHRKYQALAEDGVTSRPR